VTHAHACIPVPEVKARVIPTYVEVIALLKLPRQYHPANMADSTSNHIDSNTLEPLRIQTRLQSRYKVFDASGGLPFDNVFGLRRRSDSDPRDLHFQTTNSFLDVPYALANGLLSLHELRTSATGSKERVEVNLTCLREAIEDDQPALEYIILPSKSNRTEPRGQMGVTEYHYRVDPGSPLALLFESGKKYSIGMANRNLGVHRWIGSDHMPSSSTNPLPILTGERTIEHRNLVSYSHSGSAVFTVTESLIWPPTVETRMRLLGPQQSATSSGDDLKLPVLQVTVTNTGSDIMSIQTKGQQRFLGPWGPFQPESDDGLNTGRIPCILDPSSTTAPLQVIDATTRSIVRDSRKPGVCGLTSGRPDPRPHVDQLVVLRPGVAVNRDIQLDKLLRGLADAKYLIRLTPKGCWWHFGDVKSDPDHDGKVSMRCITAKQTPVVLESDDAVKFELIGGRVVEQ
jgi:hypothetical protein